MADTLLLNDAGRSCGDQWDMLNLLDDVKDWNFCSLENQEIQLRFSSPSSVVARVYMRCRVSRLPPLMKSSNSIRNGTPDNRDKEWNQRWRAWWCETRGEMKTDCSNRTWSSHKILSTNRGQTICVGLTKKFADSGRLNGEPRIWVTHQSLWTCTNTSHPHDNRRTIIIPVIIIKFTGEKPPAIHGFPIISNLQRPPGTCTVKTLSALIHHYFRAGNRKESGQTNAIM